MKSKQEEHTCYNELIIFNHIINRLEKIRVVIPDKRSKSYMSLSILGKLLHKLAEKYTGAITTDA